MIKPNVKTKIQATSHTAHVHRMHTSTANISSANNIIRHSMARQVDEPSPQQARSIDKILNTPK